LALRNGWQRLTQFVQAKVNDFLARARHQTVRRADDELEVLPFLLPAAIELRFVEHPLRGAVH